MADSRATLIQRVLSALFGLGLVVALSYYGDRTGLYVICTVAIVLAVREYSRMAFLRWQMPLSVTLFFWAICILFYGLMVQFESHGLIFFALCNVMFFVGVLWLTRDSVSNENLLPSLAVGTFGMLYCVLFPNFVVRLIKFEHGPSWFWFLFFVVFAGDTFAYFGGRWLGRRKLMPQISPNKTWEGCIAGLFGSTAIGGIFSSLALPHVPMIKVLAFCLACGFAAQSGDLLMSLVKRVARVKDTGGIMPGHGGILDRLDGIFIASPLVYAFAVYAR